MSIKILRLVNSTQYFIYLAWGKYEKFDRKIAKERNTELRNYFLFQKSFLERKYLECFNILIDSLERNCAHWNNMDIFSRTCLPFLLNEEKYDIVEKMSKQLLTYNSFTKQNRIALYHALGNSLYYQCKDTDLAELIDTLKLLDAEKEHPHVEWYQRVIKNKPNV